MRRFHIYIGFIVWLLTSLFAVSCTDELEGNGYTPNSSSNLHVLVPTVLSANGTRTDDASGLPTYNATVDECQINDLTLYAFPTGNEGKLLVETLPAPLATMMVEPNVANYQLNIEPGTYHIYVVANMSDVLKAQDQNINSEEKLKNIVLNYSPLGAQPGMPVCTNIPMIYEPKDINGKTTETEIKATDKSATVIANLKFTCVKVKLNLIFDPAEATVLSGKSFSIKNILAQQLTPKTSLCWNGEFSQSKVSKEYAEGFESNQYDAANNKNGLYYQGDAWERNDANANINDKDVITLNEGAKGSANPTNATAKWLFQGTYYLPERYIANASQQSRLAIKGSIDESIDNKYIIPLGHKQNESSTTELPTFPRGTYYEIIGNIKSLGNITLDGKTFIKPWKPMSIDADFSHTTLWVDKTNAKLTSITNDSIFYKTNAAAVVFGCDKKINVGGMDKDFIIAAKTYNDHITFTINPEIPYSAYDASDLTGTAKIWIKANNLIKYLDVDYNIEPLFEVDPLEVTIYWQEGAATNAKKFDWVTNLGGIDLEKTASTKGSSTISISLDNVATNATGKFTVTATTNPVTTVVHYFKAWSKGVNPKTKVREERQIKVTVKPNYGGYRIYFRAINDKAYNGIGSGENKFQVNQFDGIKPEYYETGNNNANWNDAWKGKNWDDEIHSDRHNIYIYSQIGETGSSIPDDKVWHFNGSYDAISNKGMTGDTNNPGWYYKDMSVNAEGERNDGDKTKIKPGETLMIFYSFNNAGADLHRCPHHMAPGIPLFNYEDREGWILYDPTTDPDYRIFDEKPIVKDINYVVYTKNKVLGWAFKFGVATDNPTSSGDNKQYEHWDNTWDGHSAKSFKSEQVGDWWKTTIRLKAVDGYHKKGIVLQFEKDVYDEKYTLFEGRSYEKYNDTGYYDNNSWHPGIPSGV